MDTYDVRAVVLVELHCKAWQLFVKEYYAPTVAAWSV